MLSAAERQRQYRARHPGKSIEIDRRWRENNPEKCKQRNHSYYQRNKEAEIARSAQFYRDNREYQSKRRRMYNRGVSEEWYDQKMVEQDGKCAVCKNPFTEVPHIDHDHNCCPKGRSCGECSRGLLCPQCNFGLGRFKDNVVVLANAITYLNSFIEETNARIAA